MASIYQGAYVTTAATASVDAHGGLIREVNVPTEPRRLHRERQAQYNVQAIITCNQRLRMRLFFINARSISRHSHPASLTASIDHNKARHALCSAVDRGLDFCRVSQVGCAVPGN